MSDETVAADTETFEVLETDQAVEQIDETPVVTPAADASPAAQPVDESSADSDDDDDDERTAIEKQPYVFERCTISISIQLMPTGPDGPRPVVFGIHSHGSAPSRLVACSLAELGALPAAIEGALRDYQVALPARGEAAAVALAKQKAEQVERRARLATPRTNRTTAKTSPAKKKKGVDLSAAPLIADNPTTEATAITSPSKPAPVLVEKPPAPPPPKPHPVVKPTPAIQTGQAVSLFD